MKYVWVRVRDREAHKKAAILLGVNRLGLTQKEKPPFSEESLLITWNLHGIEDWAEQLRSAGGKVIVAENPYVKYDKEGREYLAMARDGHNGSGYTPTGGNERLEALGLQFQEWRTGSHVLIADQRGIGGKKMRSPPEWGRKEEKVLRRKTGRPIVYRPHPGRVTPAALPPLDLQLQNAHAVVVWASNVATTALLKGIPVFYQAPHITLALAAKKGTDQIEDPWKGDRIPAFHKLSWSQWHLPEIASGEALKRLIECTSTPPNTSSPRPSVGPSPKG